MLLVSLSHSRRRKETYDVRIQKKKVASHPAKELRKPIKGMRLLTAWMEGKIDLETENDF